MSKTMKISSKGQVTIPKEIRDFLDTKVVEFEIEKDRVFLKPVKDVGGFLAEYSSEYVPADEARQTAWEEVAREKGNHESA